MLLSISYLFQYTGFHNLAKCFKNACSKTILETKTYVEKRANVPVLHVHTHTTAHETPRGCSSWGYKYSIHCCTWESPTFLYIHELVCTDRGNSHRINTYTNLCLIIIVNYNTMIFRGQRLHCHQYISRDCIYYLYLKNCFFNFRISISRQ